MSTAPEPFTFTPELNLKLDEIVALTGKPPERVVDEALADYRERAAKEKHGKEEEEEEAEESALEAAIRMGLRLGSIDDLPADLSTNPKYMEGFGLDED